MKNLFLLFFSTFLVAGCASTSAIDIYQQADKFDGTISIHTGESIAYGFDRVIAFNASFAYYFHEHSDSYFLSASRSGIQNLEKLKINIDGNIIELKPIGVLTRFHVNQTQGQTLTPSLYIPGSISSSSSKSFRLTRALIDKMNTGSDVKMRLITSETYYDVDYTFIPLGMDMKDLGVGIKTVSEKFLAKVDEFKRTQKGKTQ